MEEPESREIVYRQILPLFESDWLKKCKFGDEFRNEWKRVLRNAARSDRLYPPEMPEAVFPVDHVFEGVSFTFHFDQKRLYGWYCQDCKLKERRVFHPRELTRSDADGTVGIGQSKLRWDADALEPGVPEEGKEIIVCSLPGFPPPLRVVYGNRRVAGGFHGFLKPNKLNILLIQPEFTPAFFGSAFEVCLYLFWMDCCILMENQPKLKPDGLRLLLHIFRRPSMLTLKELL
ncbi:hypothetical protein OBV_11480 [Oscillibacter valericigenes Sjm18-20]|nr:hypothetical protein OBV_11480 [Oscillibacter valericigenes Sjm18-20]